MTFGNPHRRNTRRRRALLMALGSAVLAGTAIAAPAPAQAQPHGTLGWQTCADAPGRECAELSVPLDYREPDGPHTRLAVYRLRSDHPEARRGTLLLIAGGPGGAGKQMLAAEGERVRAATKGAYDIVAFDPRGVGGSTPTSCQLDPDDRKLAKLRGWPGPGGDIGENVARSRRIAAACDRNGGPLLRSLSTANEVRDIDQLRQALGERKLSAWGRSYGTYVGAWYAQQYPQHTDRWVLDSNDDPDPALVARGWLAHMAKGAEDRFPDFAKWAAAHGLAKRPQDVRPMFLALAARLDRQPGGQGNELRNTLQMSLYSDGSFQALGDAIRAAQAGRPLPSPAASDQEAAVMVATICNDARWPGEVAGYARAVATDRVRYPLTNGMPANITPCAFWKNAPADRPVRIDGHGPANVLMVQNLRDPATPYRYALRMREAFGKRARLVSVDSGGHGAYLANGNACGDAAVTAFLTEGRRPGHDLICKR
ncbi:alpha/beta hydrolase [Streptomyces orinoci]|uniref:Alpha/beta hydrolase n=1 Tax=Streptomyces orinoci TaxID=67339 RepID=A0ABV3JUB4_STRON|nr:alpha/beta hydrolase [Streptomyces orinoci]